VPASASCRHRKHNKLGTKNDYNNRKSQQKNAKKKEPKKKEMEWAIAHSIF
jgi:hypothetical protein